MANNNPSEFSDEAESICDLSRKVLDSLTAEIAVLDQKGTIVDVNEAWKKFAIENGGADTSTGIGMNYLDICRSAGGADSELAQQAYQGIESVIDGLQEVFTLEYPCHSPTSKRWFLLYASRLNCKERLVQTTHLSITDRKLAELQLVEAERLAAIGQAMQGLSHEGRNALQRAQAHIGLLRLHIDDDSEALDLLQRIECAQGHLLSLYEEVKAYADPIQLALTPHRLDKIVASTWSQLQVPDAEVSFVHHAEDTNTTCDIDPDAISQLLRLLFANALAACKAPKRIEVDYSRQDENGRASVTVIVSDNGPGVPTNAWEQVFEPFYTTKTRGTGLGLAVSQRIVKAHRGKIRLGNPRLGGTSVYISLPASSADA